MTWDWYPNQSLNYLQKKNKNNEYHDYNTRHSSSLHLSVGRGEAIYRSFSFHGTSIWNYLKMHVPIDVSYLRFKNSLILI